MLSDFRFALRSLSKSPGFALAAVLTLALGLSVNAVFFTIGSNLFLRPLPATKPDRLVVGAVKSQTTAFNIPFSFPDVQDFRQQLVAGSTATELARAFSDILGYKEQSVHLSRAGEVTERAFVHASTENYFSLLGVQPYLGRFFLPTEGHAAGAAPVIVLAFDTWSSRFHADPSIIGQAVKLNGQPFSVIGVAPRGFFGTAWGTEIDGFIPITMLPKIQPDNPLNRGDSCTFIVGRLTPGTSVAQANAALNVAFTQVMNAHPDSYLKNISAIVMKERNSRPSPYIAHHTPMIVAALSILALLVLIVAIANVANLLFTRANSRSRELAIRSALGASRFQMIRGLIAESILLSLAAGIVGMLAALWLTPLLLGAIPNPSGFAPAAPTGTDWRPFLFTTAVALVVGIVTGIIPALKASGGTPYACLKESGISSTSGRHVWRSLLVVGQVAVSCFVLICATMSLRSFLVLARIPAGFSTENRTIASFNLDLQNYTKEQGRLFHRRLLERLRSLPEVRSASLSTCMPLEPATPQNGGITAAGATKEAIQSAAPLYTIQVEHDFFPSLGMRIESGRNFTAQDRFGSPLVAVINRACAQQLFPGLDPVGRRISVQGNYEVEVVGVLAPARFYNLTTANSPLLFLSLEQKYRGNTSVIVHARDFAAPLGPLITKAVHELDPDLPVYGIRTLEQQVEESVNGLSAWRVGAVIASVQGSIVLLLAGTGIFGLVAYTVTQRTREIGIRIALGASRLAVIRSVAQNSIVLTTTGLALGVVIWFVLSRALARLLVGSGWSDVLIVGSIVLLILSSSLAACWFPVRRALRVNPIDALRAE